MSRAKEDNKTKTEELSQSQREEYEQNPSGSSIKEEEKILRMMVEQEIPAGSGKTYQFITANRNDLSAKTGHPKYLPVDTCKIMKHKDMGRKKRSGFTTGLIKAGEKLLDGSPGGFLVEMVKTLIKPFYNLVIAQIMTQP